jgi:hypothetical protein
MKTIALSNIARLRRSAVPSKLAALLALGLAGAVMAGSITPAAAHKHGGGGKHGHHQHQPKQPQNPGPIGPLPKPQPNPMGDTQWHATPKPVVVRDHRTSPPVVVRDHRAQQVVRDQRAKTATVKVAGVKVGSVTTKGKRCVGGICF